MKKTLLYSVAAFIMGVLLIVVPLIVISQIGSSTSQDGSKPSTLMGGLRQLDGDSDAKTVSNTQVIVLAIAFVIALLTYGIVGPKAPRRYNMRLGVPPY